MGRPIAIAIVRARCSVVRADFDALAWAVGAERPIEFSGCRPALECESGPSAGGQCHARGAQP